MDKLQKYILKLWNSNDILAMLAGKHIHMKNMCMKDWLSHQNQYLDSRHGIDLHIRWTKTILAVGICCYEIKTFCKVWNKTT